MILNYLKTKTIHLNISSLPVSTLKPVDPELVERIESVAVEWTKTVDVTINVVGTNWKAMLPKLKLTNYILKSTLNASGMHYFVSNQSGENPTKRKVKNHFVKFTYSIWGPRPVFIEIKIMTSISFFSNNYEQIYPKAR